MTPTIPTQTTDARKAAVDAIAFSFHKLGERVGFQHKDALQLEKALNFYKGSGSCDVASATEGIKAVYMQGVTRKFTGFQPEMIPVLREGLGLMLEQYKNTFNGTSDMEVVSWVQKGVERYLQ